MGEIIFLYVIVFGYSAPQMSYRVGMPDMQTCQSALNASISEVSHGGDSESGYSMFCGTGESHYKVRGDWVKTELK